LVISLLIEKNAKCARKKKTVHQKSNYNIYLCSNEAVTL